MPEFTALHATRTSSEKKGGTLWLLFIAMPM